MVRAIVSGYGGLLLLVWSLKAMRLCSEGRFK